jgi:predicted aspartyl protease
MRKCLPVFWAVSLALAMPGLLFATDQGAEQLIARHLAALGGRQAVASIASVLTRADIELMGTGLKGTAESRSVRPCLSYTEISLGLFKVREGYDGEHLWMVDQNGKLQIRRDAPSLEYQKTMCLLESQEFLFGGPGFTIASAGRDTVAGIPCDVLELRVEGGSDARLFLGDSTYLIERTETKAPEGLTIQTYGDYRRVAGVMFPFFERTELPAIGQKIEMRIQSIAVNEAIDPIVFLPPAGDVRDYRFAGGTGSTDVPFEYRYRHLFVPVRIAGYDEELLFLLDSGAGMTVVDSAIAAALDLPRGGEIPGAGAGGVSRFTLTRIPGLTIEGIELSEQTAIAFPVSSLLTRFEETAIGGILGYDFLSRFATRIDFDREMLTITEPDSFAPPPGAEALEAPLAHNIFTLPAAVDGAAGTFYLDTGANSSLLHASFADSARLVDGRRTLEMAIRGTGGEERAALCRFDSLRLGGFTIPSPVLAITRGTGGINALANVDGVIGNDVLERFAVTLDYRGQRVFLEKGERFDEPFFRDRSGLELARKENGRFLVVNAVPDSPASRAGLLSGDVILSVGGRKAERFGSLRELMELFEAKDGTSYRLEIRRGGASVKTTIVLERYI